MTPATAKPQRNWTAPQQAAIHHVGGDLLVSAAAGSGKTAVLAERCARLVCDTTKDNGGCGVDGLLVLTFTEAAANEMRSRIASAIRDKLASSSTQNQERARWLQRQAAMVDRASISTLHGFCARVLRQHFHVARLDPAFEVMDEDEARLLREDVLDDLMARWHTQPPAGASGNDFADFLEAYAQSRESTCRDIILQLYHMLASTADPAAYVSAARHLYSPAGCPGTLDRFVRMTVGGQLRLASLTARRAAQTVQSAVGPGDMLTGLQKAADLIDWAQNEIAQNAAAAIPGVRDALAYKWPPLKTLKDVPHFTLLKDHTWEKVKKNLQKLTRETLAVDGNQLLKDLAGLAQPLETLLRLVDEFITAYVAAKRAQNRVDFADLERLTLDLLTAPDSLAAQELRQRYIHILVDEFQDINPLQSALLEAVRSPERFGGAGNLFIVGDIKQSIYGFRLAEPRLFLDRETAARAATTHTLRRHVGLPHNFRSHPNLLTAMNALFEKLLTRDVTQIPYTEGHALEPPPAATATPDSDPSLLNGSPVELHLLVMQQGEDDEPAAEDDATEDTDQPAAKENLSAVEQEARMVAARIAGLIKEKRTLLQKDGAVRQLKYRDIAILLRSMKDKAMIFARALAQNGIPVHADLSTGYFDTAEVRDTLALLQVLDNPHQDIPLATALLGPYGRFTHDDLATLRLTYDRKLVSFSQAALRYPHDAPLLPKVRDLALDPPPPNPDLAARLKIFLEKLAAWRDRLRSRPLHEGLADIYADSRIIPTLAGLDAGSQRIANLQALHQRALRFAAFRKQGLHRFLRFIEKLRDQEGDFGEAPVLSEASDVVRIMSVHKAKGLEFPVVFVSGLGNMLNLTDSGPVYVHRDLGIGLKIADVDRNIFYDSAASSTIADSNQRTSRAEELRLLYVALTRARDHLILTGHVAKTEKLAAIRALWHDHKGPLPEDELLRSRTCLDWLLPALACSRLNIQWPHDSRDHNTQLAITLHQAAAAQAAPAEAPLSGHDETLRRLIAAEPLPNVPTADPAFARLVTRVTLTYPHESLARQHAVITVSELKSIHDEPTLDPDEIRSAPIMALHRAPADKARADQARLRGIATHRILELLDLSASPGSLPTQIESLLHARQLTADESARADTAGIAWFLNSPAGSRLRAAAARRNAGDTSIHLRREIPFAWAAPASADNASQNSADWPTIRGVIDVLLVDTAIRQAEIFDYKTDSLYTWENNAAEYQRQMRYYLHAAGDILGFPVKRATLLFLSAKQSVEVL